MLVILLIQSNGGFNTLLCCFRWNVALCRNLNVECLFDWLCGLWGELCILYFKKTVKCSACTSTAERFIIHFRNKLWSLGEENFQNTSPLYCGLGGPNSRTCIQLFVSQQQLRSLHDLIRNLRTTTLGKNTQI